MAWPAKAEKAVRLIRRGLVLAMVSGAALPLADCSSVPNAVNPIAWYRDLTGLSKNDSEGTNFNQKNLEEGNKEPYPNLASVPPPPNRALSASERAALEKSLVADRQNAHYNEEQLEAGASVPGAVSPPPPAPLSQALASQPSSTASLPSAGGGATPAASARAPEPAPAPAASASAPAPSAQRQTAAKRPASVQRGSEAPPAESSLVSPSVRSIPPGETPTSPPPAPRVAAANQAAASSAITPPPPAPPPPAPEVAATTPPPLPSGSARKGPPPVSEPVAEIAFAPGSTKLADSDSGQLADVAGLYKESGGKLRVVGYAERASGKDAAQQELKSFGMALDRAKAVAVALTRLGVPAKDISVEAAPVDAAGSAQPHAEIFVER